jgi:hypothetical protein
MHPSAMRCQPDVLVSEEHPAQCRVAIPPHRESRKSLVVIAQMMPFKGLQGESKNGPLLKSCSLKLLKFSRVDAA